LALETVKGGEWSRRVAEALRRAGYKLTPQRLKLLEILERLRYEHPTFNRLLEEARREMPTMSTSTLYSFLMVLQDLGFILLFPWEGETHVEVNPQPHVNVLDPRTGRITDIWDEGLVRELSRLLERHGVRGKLAVVNVILHPSSS